MPWFYVVSTLRLRKFLGKIRMDFKEIDPQLLRFWLFIESLKEYMQKNHEATLLFIDSSQSYHFIHKEKMEQILLAYGIPKETV